MLDPSGEPMTKSECALFAICVLALLLLMATLVRVLTW